MSDFSDIFEENPHPNVTADYHWNGTKIEVPHNEHFTKVEHPHLDISPFKSVGMDKLYLEVDAVYCNANGVLDRFEISRFEPKTLHKHLVTKFEVNYLVLHDKYERQYFFIKNAKCQLINVYSDIKADSNEPLIHTATYMVIFSYNTDAFWHRLNNNNEREGNYIALKHWSPMHQIGRHNDNDNNRLLRGAFFETVQGPVKTINYIDRLGSIDKKIKWEGLQLENPHNQHERNFMSELIENGWTAIQPNGAKEPMLYKHKQTGIIATSQNIATKAELVRRRLARIRSRNKKLLDYYFENKNRKRKQNRK